MVVACAAALVVGVEAQAVPGLGPGNGAAGARQLEVGFGSRVITPVGTPPAEWAPYFDENPVTGVWGEPVSYTHLTLPTNREV